MLDPFPSILHQEGNSLPFCPIPKQKKNNWSCDALFSHSSVFCILIRADL